MMSRAVSQGASGYWEASLYDARKSCQPYRFCHVARMTAVPILVFWALVFWGFVSPRPILIYLFFASMSFGTLAVLPPAVTGGLTLTPTPIIAVLIGIRILGNSRGLAFFLTSALFPSRMAILFGFWTVAVLVTIFMPRIFEHEVSVVPLRKFPDIVVERLHPVAQNFSQLTYLTISVFAVFAFARMLKGPKARENALRAMCLGAVVVILTGALDMASQYVPLTPLLEPFRTATYALLFDNVVLGTKRVVGLMPEASSYGNLCIGFLSLLYFLRQSIPRDGLLERSVPLLLLLLVLFSFISTSSAAYLGLAVLGSMAGLEWLWRAAVLRRESKRRQGIVLEFWLVFGVLVVLLTIVVFDPAVFNPVVKMVDELVFKKTATASYAERSSWTAFSWQALLDTYGLGVGIGSTRASNSFVSVISNVGVLGAVLYFAFVLQCLTRRPQKGATDAAAIISGLRWAFLPMYVPSFVAGTAADFGVFMAFCYGLLTAAAFADAPRSVVAAPPLPPAPMTAIGYGSRLT